MNFSYGTVSSDNEEKVHIISNTNSCPIIEHVDTYCGFHSDLINFKKSDDVTCPNCIELVFAHIDAKIKKEDKIKV